MADTTIPEALRDIFDEPALGAVSYHSERGQIVSFPMWVDYDGEHVVTSSRAGAPKSRALRRNPEIAVCVVSTKNPFKWVSVTGRVTDIGPDEGLAFIDKMSRKYVGRDYFDRGPREKFVITIERVAGWEMNF